MSDDVLVRGTRLKVIGPLGGVDVVVPPRARIRVVVDAYAERTGVDDGDLDGMRALVPMTATGRTCDPDAAVADCDLGDGSLLMLAASAPTRPTQRPTQRPSERPRGAADQVSHDEPASPSAAVAAPLGTGLPPAAVLIGLAAAAGCVLAAATALALADSGPVRVVGASLLAACAVLAALTAGRGPDRIGRFAASPVFGAAAGFAAAYDPGPGGLLLGLGVGALGAALAAGLARMVALPDEEDLLRIVLVLAVALAAIPALIVVLGAGSSPLWSLLLVAGVVTPKCLPMVAVDVPDRALIDVDRLAVTAWSARETLPSGRRRSLVSERGVRQVAGRGTRVLDAGTVAMCVLAAVSACLVASTVLRRPEALDEVRGIAAWSSVGLGAVSLALAARAFRSVVSRTAMRIAATICAAAWAVVLLRTVDGIDSLVLAGAAVLGSALVITAAVALGRGWRSVWWGRLADVAEVAATVLVVALIPLSTGLHTVVSEFLS